MSIVHIRTNEDGEEVQFRPDAAASFRRIERQAGREVSVNRTVVPYDVQEELYERRQRGEYPYTVAHPDESDHVYRTDDDGGNAWDTEERGDWLDENGWIADVKDEPWHRRYIPARDKHINDPETPESEEDMSMRTIRHPNGTIFVIDELGADHLGDYKTADIGLGEFIGAAERIFGPPEQLSAREFDITVAIHERRAARYMAALVDAVAKRLRE